MLQITPVPSATGDMFGRSVALFGLWMVGGAPLADTTDSEENGTRILMGYYCVLLKSCVQVRRSYSWRVFRRPPLCLPPLIWAM